jgi:hypothetical protein
MSLAGTTAVNCVLLTKNVCNALVFQYTVDPGIGPCKVLIAFRKPVPLTVNVNPAVPTVALAGEIKVTTGALTLAATASVTGMICGELRPPGTAI